MAQPPPAVDASPVPAPAERGLGVPRRRLLTGFAILGGAAAACLAGLAGLWVLLVALSWPHQEPAGNPQWGINYDCDYDEYLFLEVPGGPFASDDRPGRAQYCAGTLGTLLSGLGAKYVRISVHWDEVEPQEGVYDFSLLDALLAEADRQGAKVLLTVGMKGQRHPEYYIPDWALQRSHVPDGGNPADDPYLHDRAIEMVKAVVAHASASTAVDSWSAENEPLIASPRANNWHFRLQWVEEVRDTIRANDPARRPVLAAHAQHFVFDRRWQDLLDAGDILGASIYPFRDHRVLGIDFVVPILEIGPFASNYAYQAREARDQGKQFWITEMQGEPWINIDPRLVGPDNASPNLTEAKFRKSVEYARKTGASRVYLWGAEWWLYQKDHYNDSWWWDLARDVIATSPATSLQTANQSR